MCFEFHVLIKYHVSTAPFLWWEHAVYDSINDNFALLRYGVYIWVTKGEVHIGLFNALKYKRENVFLSSKDAMKTPYLLTEHPMIMKLLLKCASNVYL